MAVGRMPFTSRGAGQISEAGCGDGDARLTDCCASITRYRRVEDCCCLLLHLRQDVAVCREGQANVGMAEPFADHLGMYTRCHQECRVAMAKPMERNAWHSSLRRQLDEAV